MPFVNFSSKRKVKIFEGITRSLHNSRQLTLAYFTIDTGELVPEHNHAHEQRPHVLSHDLEFKLGGETMVFTPGIAAHIPSNVSHSAQAITACKITDCFTPVREDFFELENRSN